MTTHDNCVYYIVFKQRYVVRSILRTIENQPGPVLRLGTAGRTLVRKMCRQARRMRARVRSRQAVCANGLQYRSVVE